MRSPIAVLAAVTLMSAGLAGPSSAAPAGDCADQYVEALAITARARRDAYDIGETAVIDVRVTDKATGRPESDVDTGAFIDGRRDKVVFGTSKTNDGGRAVLHIELKRRHTKPGWANTFVGAYESINTPAYCTGRYGQRRYARLFRIRA